MLSTRVCFGYDDAGIAWRELESDHFIIHFPETREEFARRALAIAEEAHGKLSLLLAHTPKEKTHLGVTDDLDEANGWARAVPLNEIRLYPYPPHLSEELGLYDDWVRQLIYHEYTHILQMDTSHGLHNVINAIFGKMARNNATAPRWYTEGLAVYYETLLSHSGRLRNALYRTMLRNAALAHTIPSLGELSAGTRQWPLDAGYYLYGSFFLAYIAEKYGSESLTRWNHEYGDDWIPYAMNRAALRIWGKTWDELYQAWTNEITASFESEYSEEASRVTPHQSLISPWRHARPQVLPSGNAISHIHNDGIHERTIARYDLNTQKSESLFECWGTCQHRWNEDGTLLYFMHSPIRDGYQQYERLYVYSVESETIEMLDQPPRVRSFDLDGDDLYFVVQSNESNILYRYSTTNKTLVRLYHSRPLEQIEDIAVRNHIIVASVFDPERMHADLQIYEGDAWHPLTQDVHLESSPFWIDDAEIGYISDAGGALNLYRVRLDEKTPQRMTHLLDGILHPAVAPNGDIYYTQYTADGTTIGVIRHEDLGEFPSFTPSPSAALSEEERDTASLYAPLAEVDEASRRYRPWHWLWPLTWTPQFSYTEEYKASVGIGVQADDISDHHSYTLNLDYLTGKEAIQMAFFYAWTGALYHLNLDFGINQYTARYTASGRSLQFDYQSLYADIQTSRAWNGRTWAQSVSLTYHLGYLESKDKLSWSKRDPGAVPVVLPSLGWKNAVLASWSWSRFRQGERALFANNGVSLRGSLRFEAPWLGAEAYALIADARASAALPMPWLDGHQINVTVSGGGTWSEDKARMPFSISSSTGMQIGGSTVSLHGYPAGLLYGRHYLYGYAGYSALLSEFALGHSTLPVGLNRLGLQGYAEWGYSWSDEWDITRSKFALGANLVMDALLGYRLPVRIHLGYAWGGAPQGGHAFYLLWGY